MRSPVLIGALLIAAFCLWVNSELQSACYFTRYNCEYMPVDAPRGMDASAAAVVQ